MIRNILKRGYGYVIMIRNTVKQGYGQVIMKRNILKRGYRRVVMTRNICFAIYCTYARKSLFLCVEQNYSQSVFKINYYLWEPKGH
jgi:hypothetical protein